MTTRIRIAVAVDNLGNYHWVEADVPVPQLPGGETIEGEVL